MNYTQDQKECFKYFNGANTVFADPLSTYRKILVETRGKPNELQRAASMRIEPPDEMLKTLNIHVYMQAEQEYAQKLADASHAADLLEELTRKVFGMVAFDSATGQGANSYHCMKVWDDFAAFMSKKKPKPESEPTLSTPTDGLPTTSQITTSGLVSS